MPLKYRWNTASLLQSSLRRSRAAAFLVIARGFIDIQVNGYKGIDYSDDGLDAAKMLQLVRHLAAGGTTQHLATIVTRPHEHMVRNLKAIVRARQESAFLRFAISGVHLEGPWISLEDGPRGAHDPRYIRTPDFEEFQKLQDAAQGLIKIVTLAQALKLCTVNPARLLAKAGVKLAGKLAVGAPADIVLFYFDGGQRLSVRSTLLYGELMA